MDKVRVIERSIRCRDLGCYGLIPVVGMVPAIFAVVLYHRVRYEALNDWNPAEREARRGFIFAWVGLALTAVALGLGFAFAMSKLI
jgi:hypothetical protein